MDIVINTEGELSQLCNERNRMVESNNYRMEPKIKEIDSKIASMLTAKIYVTELIKGGSK